MLATSAPWSDRAGQDNGYARVYTWNIQSGVNGYRTQRGDDIIGTVSSLFGFLVDHYLFHGMVPTRQRN